MKSSIFVSGAAGFIGSSLSRRLINNNYTVIGIDNFYNSYPVSYKHQNIKQLLKNNCFKFIECDIRNKQKLEEVFAMYKPKIVIHLAALTGVRKSLTHPELYFEVNVKGTENVYMSAIKYIASSFIISSSSSVYGDNPQLPFLETHILKPQSPYAKTKCDAESLIKHLFNKHKIPTAILRFFSVYGPSGRPDMAPYLFTHAAFNQTKITQYGDGKSARDYTYIEDVVNAIKKMISNMSSWSLLNIGNSSPVTLLSLIEIVEKYTDKKISLEFAPYNKSESFITYADICRAQKDLAWFPNTKFEDGMQKFIDWFKIHRL